MFLNYYNIMKGVVMKYLIFLILSIAMIVTFTNCKQKGSIADIARIQQAQNAIKIIRNALEEHYIDKKTYPPNDVNLEEVLKPYIPKVAIGEGDSISKWEKEIVPAFSEGPFYTTEDPEINYFVKARARDSNKTPVTIRPGTIREKKEEENDKKKGK